MIGVHADIVALQVKGKLTVFDVLQLILVQVGPSPQPGVDHMRESFTSSHLDGNQPRVRWGDTGDSNEEEEPTQDGCSHGQD